MTKSNLFFEEELLESRKLRKPIKILSEKEENILSKNKSLFSIKKSPYSIKNNSDINSKKDIIQVYSKHKNNTERTEQNNTTNKENKIKKLVIKIAPLKDSPKTKRNQFQQIVYFSRIEKKEESKELAKINKDTFLYDKNNKIVATKEDMKQIADDWFNFKYKKKNEEISRHIVFSIGVKEDKQKVLDMSAKFFENEFKVKGFDYVYAPHYDTANDHIHLLIRKRNDFGRNLTIYKKDLTKLRSRYNQELKNIGIDRDISLRVENQRTLDNIQKQQDFINNKNNIYQSQLANGTKDKFNAYQYKSTLSAILEEQVNFVTIDNHIREYLKINDESLIRKIQSFSRKKGAKYVINNISSVRRNLNNSKVKNINGLLLKALEQDYYKSDKWKHIKNEFVITRENKEAINELRKIKSEIIAKDNAKEIKEILNDISNRLNPINPKISKSLNNILNKDFEKIKYSYLTKKTEINDLEEIVEQKIESHKRNESYYIPELSDRDIQQKFFEEIMQSGKIKPTGLETAISSAFANHNTKIRFGQKKQNEICWYGEAGYVKNYKIKDSYLSWGVRNIKQDQNNSISYKQITKEELEEYKKQQEQEILNREKEKLELYQQTSLKQEQILKDAKNIGNSQYLKKKQIDDIKFTNIKFDQNNNPLIPIRDINGKLWSVQTIYNNGKKPFAKDSMTRGNFYLINKDKIDKDKSIIIAEGFSTIASIYKSIDNKDINFVSCLNAGNMLAVVESIKATYPTQQIILMADNDEKNLIKNLTNIGLEAAKEIKEKYSDIKVLYPKFTDEEIKKEKLSDFNDLAVKRGVKEIKKELKENGVELEVERGVEIER
jgi:phage/plasmid primase-like uncharacterized protein